MELKNRIDAFSKLGAALIKISKAELDKPSDTEHEVIQCIGDAFGGNGWFNEYNTRLAIENLGKMLNQESLKSWIKPYTNQIEINDQSPKNIGVIMAGNIPMVGFHDMLCVLVSGNTFKGKLSAKDKNLLPAVANLLIDLEPGFKGKIEFTEDKLEKVDAIIATGSNNTSRYMEYYFGKYPHIIRKNRNSVAIMSGRETKKELEGLGHDIFTFFGLGCRNISKVYIPNDYDLDKIFKASLKYSDIKDNNKYINNFEYHRAIYLLDNIDFYENGFFILKPDAGIPSPVATLHYQHYNSIEEVVNELNLYKDKIQCIASNCDIPKSIPLGTVQKPQLEDYADGIDTMNFLSSLS